MASKMAKAAYGLGLLAALLWAALLIYVIYLFSSLVKQSNQNAPRFLPAQSSITVTSTATELWPTVTTQNTILVSAVPVTTTTAESPTIVVQVPTNTVAVLSPAEDLVAIGTSTVLMPILAEPTTVVEVVLPSAARAISPAPTDMAVSDPADRLMWAMPTEPPLLLQEREFVVDAAGNTLPASQYPVETTGWWETILRNGDHTWVPVAYTQTFATEVPEQWPQARSGSIGLREAQPTNAVGAVNPPLSMETLPMTGGAAGLSTEVGGISLVVMLVLAIFVL